VSASLSAQAGVMLLPMLTKGTPVETSKSAAHPGTGSPPCGRRARTWRVYGAMAHRAWRMARGAWRLSFWSGWEGRAQQGAATPRAQAARFLSRRRPRHATTHLPNSHMAVLVLSPERAGGAAVGGAAAAVTRSATRREHAAACGCGPAKQWARRAVKTVLGPLAVLIMLCRGQVPRPCS
jgi:hypothetical protein